MLVVRWKRQHLARCQQRPRGFLAADHDMRQPRCEPVPGIVAHCALLGRCSERVRDALGRPLVIVRTGDADLAVERKSGVEGKMCQYGEDSVGAVSLKKTNKPNQHETV